MASAGLLRSSAGVRRCASAKRFFLKQNKRKGRQEGHANDHQATHADPQDGVRSSHLWFPAHRPPMQGMQPTHKKPRAADAWSFGIQTHSWPKPQPIMRRRFLERSCIIVTPGRRSFWEGDV
jgi:hypothetical protein